MPHRFPCPECGLDVVTLKPKGEIAHCPGCGAGLRVPATAEGRVAPDKDAPAAAGSGGLSCLLELVAEGILGGALLLLAPPDWVVVLILVAMVGVGILVLRRAVIRA